MRLPFGHDMLKDILEEWWRGSVYDIWWYEILVGFEMCL